MQAYRAVVTHPHHIELESCEVPSPAEGQVLIQTQTSLISPGTERAFFLHLPNTTLPYPLYPGYSNIGEVIAVGEGVDLAIGQRVASTAPHASHALMSDDRCHVVPVNLPDGEACFFNLIAIAMQAVHKARIELGESVAVIGAGMIGLFAMQLARLCGGLPVACIDTQSERLNLAKQVGADETYTPDNTTGDWQVVIEATGASAAILNAFHMAAVRGRVLLLGSSRGDTDGVNFYRDVHRKGLTIIGAHEATRPTYETSAGWWTQSDEHRIALELLARKRILAQPLTTHRFAWQEFPKAYQLLADWNLDAMGMVIDWTG